METKRRTKIQIFPHTWNLKTITVDKLWRKTRTNSDYKNDYKKVIELKKHDKKYDKNTVRKMKNKWGFWPLQNPKDKKASSAFRAAFSDKYEFLKERQEELKTILEDCTEAWSILRKIPKCRQALENGIDCYNGMDPDEKQVPFDFFCYYSDVFENNSGMQGVNGGEWLMLLKKGSDGKIYDGNDNPLECQDMPESLNLEINLFASLNQIKKDITAIVSHFRVIYDFGQEDTMKRDQLYVLKEIMRQAGCSDKEIYKYARVKEISDMKYNNSKKVKALKKLTYRIKSQS